MKILLISNLCSGKPIAPRIESRVKDMGDNSYQITWITDSYASIEQYRLLYRKSPVGDSKIFAGLRGQIMAWRRDLSPHMKGDTIWNKGQI